MISLSSFSTLTTATLPNFRRFKLSAVMASTVTTTKVHPAVIVGGGRVGKALQGMGDGQDVLVRRGDSIPIDFDGPILVCTRNDDLDSVLQTTPLSRWNDLVFFQNGMLEPWLESKGLKDGNQVLAYFAVSKLGESPIDGKTDTNPEGLTAAYGKWSLAVAERLQAGGLSCKVLDKEAFEKQMLEKLIWICSVMLVGARHGGVPVGVVEKEFHSELCSLIAELASAAASEKGFKWRNGWFYSLFEKATAQGKPDPCPLHTQWLKELKIASRIYPDIDNDVHFHHIASKH
ncbi:hypothetical protein TSUD_260390 [Trifolium subterraneum]|uniref:Uncharacterized protein n=1 Tax=Trifolium subterraneum TaxID=3900 RepID=A0A2Z6MPV0_TRISU|nr:hypothetical protein TSUD_260390 [Trifolium subterraneum]